MDGLHKNWESGAKSYYKDKSTTTDVPFAIQRLNRNEIGQDNITIDSYDQHSFEQYTVNNKRIVSKMPLKLFQERLIHHFDIRFKKNDIVWPQRLT